MTRTNLSPVGTGFLYFAGARFWTASVLPALMGTTLPFWLRPPGFAFNWAGAGEFIVATVMMHTGFRILQARIDGKAAGEWTEKRLLWTAVACMLAACALGFHIASHTTRLLFFAYGATSVVAGLLYVLPPARLSVHVGGEITASISLGMLPVLGGYIVQVGDLTRTVYVAALPMVVATGLSVWTGLLATRSVDRAAGRETLVDMFGERFSGRAVVPVLAAGIYVFLAGAVFYGSLTPWALVALLTFIPTMKVVRVSWSGYSDTAVMAGASRTAFVVHLSVGAVFALSSLLGLAR